MVRQLQRRRGALVAKLFLFKTGFGDAATRFAVKAQDHKGAGALTEAALTALEGLL
jgi:hypothetical protein